MLLDIPAYGPRSLGFRHKLLEWLVRDAMLLTLPPPRRRYYYVSETGGERFATTDVFLDRGYGDCDDTCVYLCGYMRQQGTHWYPVIVRHGGRLHAMACDGRRLYESLILCRNLDRMKFVWPITEKYVVSGIGNIAGI